MMSVKMKPNDPVISDDVLDVIMMPTFYNSQVMPEDYGVIVYEHEGEKAKPRTRNSFANSSAWKRGAYGKY